MIRMVVVVNEATMAVTEAVYLSCRTENLFRNRTTRCGNITSKKQYSPRMDVPHSRVVVLSHAAICVLWNALVAAMRASKILRVGVSASGFKWWLPFLAPMFLLFSGVHRKTSCQ